MEVTLPQAAATVLINASLAWVVGALASRFWLRVRTASWQEAAVTRLSRMMATALVCCMAGILLSLWVEAAAMGEVSWPDAWPAFKAMLMSTHYGHAGAVAAAILLVALLIHWRLSRRGAGLRYLGTMTALVFLVAAARVAIGHAFEHGPWSAAVWLEWLHLLSMALWAGVVFAAGWAVLPLVLARESLSSRERGAYLRSMSNWATVALAVILATGAYNLYRVLGSPRDLVATDYGTVLMLKLLFVVAAIGLGGFNRFIGLPAALSADAVPAKAQRGLGTVIAVLRIESIALLLALIAAAIMTNSAPPGQ